MNTTPGIFNIACEIESEAESLKVCVGLMNEALQFRYSEAEEAEIAQAQLFFLVDSLQPIRERLEALAAAAFATNKAQETAA